MRITYRHILLVVTVGLFQASVVMGAGITILSNGAGGFTVQGESMNGVTGVEMTIGYDSSKLATPAVRWGSLISGALSIANPNVPGSIKIAIIKHEPITISSGPIATIQFASQSGDCGITSISAKLIDDKAASVPVQAVLAAGVACSSPTDSGLISTPGVPFSQPTPSTPTTSAQPAAASTTTATGLGTVALPGDPPVKKEEKPTELKVPTSQETVEKPETVSTQAKQTAPERSVEEQESASVKQTVYGSVLDRFRLYQGERTPEILVALFTKEVSSTLRQEPAVLVSDGAATARLMVDLTAVKGTSTNFALTGANLISLKNGEESGKWVLDVVPQANGIKATVTIVNSRTVIEYPLTVVPPAKVVTASRADFETFLKDSGATSPRFDLNGDGRHDYLDDYIYTAHYLIQARGTGKAAK